MLPGSTAALCCFVQITHFEGVSKVTALVAVSLCVATCWCREVLPLKQEHNGRAACPSAVVSVLCSSSAFDL